MAATMNQKGRKSSMKMGKSEVVKQLQSGGRIVSIIKRAESKRVAKHKIIQWLQKKGLTQHTIEEAYSKYYASAGFYEIMFEQRPLGFTVIMDIRGKNAIVASIGNEANAKLGLKIASRVYAINGKRVDDTAHDDIVKLISQQVTPFSAVFKQSNKKSSKMKKQKLKIEQEIEKALRWQTSADFLSDDDGKSDREDSMPSICSYDSDDDEAHVFNYHRHHKTEEQQPLEDHTANTPISVFKPHELDQWNEQLLADEQHAMLEQLSHLLTNTPPPSSTTMFPNNHSADSIAAVSRHFQQHSAESLRSSSVPLRTINEPESETTAQLKKKTKTLALYCLINDRNEDSMAVKVKLPYLDEWGLNLQSVRRQILHKFECVQSIDEGKWTLRVGGTLVDKYDSAAFKQAILSMDVPIQVFIIDVDADQQSGKLPFYQRMNLCISDGNPCSDFYLKPLLWTLPLPYIDSDAYWSSNFDVLIKKVEGHFKIDWGAGAVKLVDDDVCQIDDAFDLSVICKAYSQCSDNKLRLTLVSQPDMVKGKSVYL